MFQSSSKSKKDGVRYASSCYFHGLSTSFSKQFSPNFTAEYKWIQWIPNKISLLLILALPYPQVSESRTTSWGKIKNRVGMERIIKLDAFVGCWEDACLYYQVIPRSSSTVRCTIRTAFRGCESDVSIANHRLLKAPQHSSLNTQAMQWHMFLFMKLAVNVSSAQCEWPGLYK